MTDPVYRRALHDLAEEERQAGAEWLGPEAFAMVLRHGTAVLDGLPAHTRDYVIGRLQKLGD